MVRLEGGGKMSKSSGHTIDPVDLSNKFGTDAERMSLVVANTPGTDFRISEDKVKTYKNFANKVWNITRFILESTKGTKLDINFSQFSDIDNTLIMQRDEFVSDITKDIDEYRFYMASEKIYHYIWDSLADKILEESKKIFKEGSERKNIQKTFCCTLKKTIVCIHLCHL
jgi:valyl-tRNA synthetase